jgi:peptide-methionine (S)-S-oxide reductase
VTPKVIIMGTLSAIAFVGLLFALMPGNGNSSAGTVPESQSEKTGWAVATFAGGCFWCMEPPYDALDGVISTISGYTGGRLENPTYEQVSSGGTGHYEAIQIQYDPEKVTYEKLLEVFWVNVDPTDGAGQFCDRGSQYRTAIFYHSEEQREAAQASKMKLEESGRLSKPVVTPIVAASTFYAAEDYHQDYYKRNPIRYKFYRAGCGRDRVLKKLWGGEAK